MVCVCVEGGGQKPEATVKQRKQKRSTWDSGTCRLGLPAHLLYLLNELLALRAQPAASCHCRPHLVSCASSLPLFFFSPISHLTPPFSCSTHPFISQPLLCPPALFLIVSLILASQYSPSNVHSFSPVPLGFVIVPLCIAVINCCAHLTLAKPDYQVSFMGYINCKCVREREIEKSCWALVLGWGLNATQLSKPGPPQQHFSCHSLSVFCFLFLIHTFSLLSVWGRSRRRNAPKHYGKIIEAKLWCFFLFVCFHLEYMKRRSDVTNREVMHLFGMKGLCTVGVRTSLMKRFIDISSALKYCAFPAHQCALTWCFLRRLFSWEV